MAVCNPRVEHFLSEIEYQGVVIVKAEISDDIECDTVAFFLAQIVFGHHPQDPVSSKATEIRLP